MLVKNAKLSTLFLLTLLVPQAAGAAIGVSPDRLDFDIERGETQTKKIFIENLNDDATQIMIAAERHNDIVSINTGQLTLPPRTIQDVQITASGKQSFTDNIEVIAFENQGGGLNVQSGIKIPIVIKLGRDTGKALTTAAVAALLTTGLFILVSRKIKRKKTTA